MTKDNIIELLTLLGFERNNNEYTKEYNTEVSLKVDISGEGHIYYSDCGITIGRRTTCSLTDPENLVVLNCIDQLLTKGYQPQHLELEPGWRLGHGSKGGYADIWIRTYRDGPVMFDTAEKESLCIIECKTWGNEYDGAWEDTEEDGAQLFSYFQQEKGTKFLCLYTANIIDGAINQDYRLINVQDNKELLESDETLKGYSGATNNKELYATWRDTYHCEYATRGLFEDDIAPYEIGKNKYTVKDLDPVSSDTIQKKYNEFALILRQHNVGGHENAFDKLVNLFLAKVVDETNNPDDLQFYWKGSAYDDAYRLQDRLQRLYRDGMKRFLNEDVTYIEDSEIEKAFRRFRNDPDATKRTIKEYFRALKFFSDNDFSFISVHNKRLFEQNAAILLKVVKMLQDIKLKGTDQNQLLGDLFEGFLNKGVKQSEGQFFTPMPIVRFLVSSLPLEQFVRDREDLPCAIDYACGAGHFLTEYAVQIEEFVRKYRPDIPLKEYYARITGIEKEYRLSKVSKVSAFMYGHDEINIIYTDALAPHPDIRDGSYDVLIANPPYSVKGFLEMLTEQQRKQYSLFTNELNLGKNNAIETFFIERAAQLLRAGGVAGIILPDSVLNKEGIYARAREIILQDFDIVAIAQLGSGTFGKTGTSTISLFLRRKETNTPDAEHLSARVASWFGGHHETDEIYDDAELLDAYCEHLGYSKDDYRNFLSGVLTESFMNHDTIQAYRTAFFGNGRNAMKGVCNEAKDTRSRFVSRQRTQAYRRQAEALQQKEADAAFFQFVTAIEREKVYYYLLCATMTNPIVIVKSPSTNTEMKRFLGYEWSDSKGNEGIKYLNVTVQDNDENEGEEDDNTMQQIRGIDGIHTPLFNPANLYDTEKINSIIRAAFTGEEIGIPDELSSVISIIHSIDLLDYKRAAFIKDFRTNASLKFEERSKFETIPIKTFCTDINPSKEEFQSLPGDTMVSFVDMASLGTGLISQKDNKTIHQLSNGGYTNFRENDVLVAKITPCMENGKCALAEGLTNGLGLGSTEFHVFRTSSKERSKYLLEYLNRESVRVVAATYMTGASGHRRVPEYFYKQLPIPNAPDTIIKQIASECEQIDVKYQQASLRLIEIDKQIESLFQQAQAQAFIPVKLNKDEVFDIRIGQRVLKSEIVEDGKYCVYSANVFEPFGRTKHSILSDFSMPSVVWGIDGDWQVNYIEKDILFNPTDHCGVIRVLDETVALPRYLVYPLLKAGETERFSRVHRASTDRIRALTFMLPPINIQQQVINQVNPLEQEANNLRQLIGACSEKKQVILDKYLK